MTQKLSSPSSGVDAEAANALGVRVIHALGLPAKCAPETAGAIVAQTVRELLAEGGAVDG